MSMFPCKFCASPLPSNSLVCSHCKQRNPISPLIQEKQETMTLDNPNTIECVECHTQTMKFVDIGDYQESISTLKCSECQGIFISFELLEKGIMHYGLKRKKIPNKIDAPEEKKINRDNLYSCPICSQTMKRFLYKISSNVIIDKCDKHGVWLNHGEFKDLIEWKKALKTFKNREAEEAAYKKYGLKKTKSPYTYQKHTNSRLDSFLEWLIGY